MWLITIDAGQCSEPIQNLKKITGSRCRTGKRVQASHDLFWFYFGLAEKVARDSIQSQSVAIIIIIIIYELIVRSIT